MRTEALVLAEKDAPFVWQEVELQDPQPNEVLVKVRAVRVRIRSWHKC